MVCRRPDRLPFFMSNVTHTISNILEIVSDLRGESSTNTDASRVRAVSRAERDFARRMFFRIHLRRLATAGTGDGSTQDFEIGTTTYVHRPKGLTEVFVGGTTEDKRYQVIDYHKYINEYNKNSSERIAYEWFDVANDKWKVHINPAPASGDTVYYSHFFEPAAKTSSSDNVYCSNPMILAKLAMVDIFYGEDEDDKAEATANEAEQMIAELIGIENSPAINQTYSMGSIENSIRPHGIGSY